MSLTHTAGAFRLAFCRGGEALSVSAAPYRAISRWGYRSPSRQRPLLGRIAHTRCYGCSEAMSGLHMICCHNPS